MSGLPHRLALVLVLTVAASSSGCQLRSFLSIGNEAAEPLPDRAAPRAQPAPRSVVKAPPVAKTTPIKTEDSIIFPQPRAVESAPQTLQPDLAVRASSQAAASADTRRDRHSLDNEVLPMPPPGDPKVPPALRTLLTRAAIALSRGQVKRSGALFAEATGQAPFNPYALHGFAVTQARQGKFAKARSLAARSQFINATDRKLARANARLLEELDDALRSRAAGRPTRRRN